MPEGLGGLVNNAGVAMPGAIEDMNRDALRETVRSECIWYAGADQCTCSERCVKQGWGRIVTVSSIYGLIAAPMVGAYCASKFAVEALADAQRVELSGTGISLSLIEPGPIVSAFRRNAAVAMEENVITDDVRYADSYKKEAARRKETV